MAGSITEEDRKFVETWANVAPGSYTIIKLDARGDEKYDLISGNRQFFVTTEERLINQERISGEHDPFTNGAFRPVVVPDTVTVESNPNALADEEIQRVLKSSDLAWEEWMKVIDSPATITRMMAMAEEAEISLKRYKQLEKRLAEVKPVRRVASTDPLVENFLNPKPGGGTGVNTASSGSNNPRRRGGMSSDYR